MSVPALYLGWFREPEGHLDSARFRPPWFVVGSAARVLDNPSQPRTQQFLAKVF